MDIVGFGRSIPAVGTSNTNQEAAASYAVKMLEKKGDYSLHKDRMT